MNAARVIIGAMRAWHSRPGCSRLILSQPYSDIDVETHPDYLWNKHRSGCKDPVSPQMREGIARCGQIRP